MRKYVESILIWGSLWGLEEATLGHFLHMLPANIGWVFYFPLAYAFMNAVFQRTNKVSSILYTSLLASAIKLCDLFITTQIQRVINPAVAIVLEGATVFAVYMIIAKRPQLNIYKLGKALVASVGQEILFMAYVAVIPLFATSFHVVSGFSAYAAYIYHGLVNAVTIFVFLKYFKTIADKIRKPRYAFIDSLRLKKITGYVSAASPYLLPVIAVYISMTV